MYNFSDMEIINEGETSTVYFDGKQAIKVEVPDPEFKGNHLFKKEESVKNNNIISSKYGVSPYIHNFFKNKNLIYTVMDRVSEDYFWTHPNNSFNLNSLVYAKAVLQEEGILHNDIDKRNVLHHKETGEIMLIDFDDSINLGRPLTDEESFKDWYYFRDLFIN